MAATEEDEDVRDPPPALFRMDSESNLSTYARGNVDFGLLLSRWQKGWRAKQTLGHS